MKRYLIVLTSLTGQHKEIKQFASIKDARQYAEKEKIANGCIHASASFYDRRTTKDEWQLHVNYGYGHGFEHETSEDTLQTIKQRQKEYRENCPQYQTKIICKRVKLDS